MLPADLGLSDQQFAQAVAYGPATRPDRYTILEHLDLDDEEIGRRVSAYVQTYGR
jgi:glycerol-1-phosphate dehydrogenase [NAD(P)+]